MKTALPPAHSGSTFRDFPADSTEIAVDAVSLPDTPLAEVYNPEEINARYRQQPLRVFWRWIQILVPVISIFLNRWWDGVTGQTKKNLRQRAVQLRETLTKLGPAYIKVGQALSTRPDLVPAIYLEELTKLQDQLPAFSNDIAFQFIEEELGARPEELYAELSPNPIAAASLGQVYRGRLKTGEEVAVKVQRPGLAEQITLDIYIVRGLAEFIQKTRKLRSDLVAILDEFSGRLFEEMDYTQEGRNAERFARLYGYLPDIFVPRIFWQYTNRRVLTMEWVNGTKLNQPNLIQAQGIDPRYLVNVGVQCSLRQLLEHGFFHADPHPGNLLAMPNGKLAYLDFGMMSEIEPAQRYGLINAIVHIVNREFESLAEDYVHLGFLTPDTDLRPIIPALGIVFNNALGASVAELNIQRIFDQLSEVMYEYPFRVPAYYALIVRSLLTMEGIAMGVDTNFKVLNAAYPYIAKRLLTDPAPELRTSLKNLLFKDGSFRWNRLENLLRNARDSRDYDFDMALNQAIEFLFSERGEFIRNKLADELVKSLDQWGQQAWHQFPNPWRTPSPITAVPAVTPDQQGLEHIRRIAGILQDTPGFDAAKLLPIVSRVLFKPETQQLGQRIATGLVQRVLTRFIREFLLGRDQAEEQVYTPAL
ncbi:AarF/ABC1/UbiB kinase family protein [Synechococcus sp. PCC 6312]|uniref:ABC1 kinase family protein n=1 Tax=Synechococcus sp. (strain ATCC 27167 / PCC 6312) TaxID=195253 RepID=UPI00029F06E1|nr:AarF/ABC1/UbiB kinase family protein [Synechococcus sp. PCC 6312]AFY59807.1 putative unusual protein kinase [Synechococcus sp. PCC 6312]